jgi:uncharacterized protein (TIGR03435 family)
MLIQPRKFQKPAALLALGIVTALPVCAHLHAAVAQPQAPGTVTPVVRGAKKLEFEAASVRPSTQNSPLKGVDFLNPASDAAPHAGGLFSWNVSLPWLINFAYDLRSSQIRRGAREALPKWAQDDWYTIEARAEGNPTRDDVRQMVRSLLEARFQFAAHAGKREGQVYALVVAKPGSALKPHPEGAPCTISSSQADETKFPQMHPSYESVPAHCGIFNRELSHSGEHRLEMLNVTMQQIADSLGLGLPLLVVDKTGLTGRYDAVLDFASGDLSANTDSSDEIGLPPLPGALEKEAGLKLVKQNAEVETFLIDHIQKLSGN